MDERVLGVAGDDRVIGVCMEQEMEIDTLNIMMWVCLIAGYQKEIPKIMRNIALVTACVAAIKLCALVILDFL